MAIDGQFYVSLNYEWGTDENGVLVPKNKRSIQYVSMDHVSAMKVQGLIKKFAHDMDDALQALGESQDK